MAGFWHLSSTMMFDQIGQPAGGAQAFFYPADTLTQLVVYRDSGLTVPWTQPVEADGFGRMPNVYLDDTGPSYYRFRVTDDTGVELIALATIPVLTNASGGGGGGGGSVDPTTILNTGDMVFSPMQGVRAGAVRCNGLTIGNAVSGASERANSDCQALFLFLFQNLSDTVCPVSGGRTTAAADFAANKRMGLPDFRGRAPFGLDGMGNSLAGVITVGVIATNNTPGSSGGSSAHILSVGEMPTHLHGVGTLVAANESLHTHGPGTLGTNTESAHTHGIGSYIAAGESAHTHGSGTLSTDTVAAHTHGPGSLVTGTNNVGHTHTFPTYVAGGTANHTAIGGVTLSDLTTTSDESNTHTHSLVGGVSASNGSHSHAVNAGSTAAGSSHTHTLSGTSGAGSAHSHSVTTGATAAGSAHTHTLSGSTANAGLGTPMINLSPAFLGTWFIKL